MYTSLSSKIVIVTFSLTTVLMLSACSNPRSTPVMDDMPDTSIISGDTLDTKTEQEIDDLINGIIDTIAETGDQAIETTLSRDEAIAIAEPLLFQTYGTGLIVSEKPYNASLSGGYWAITGSLPDGHVGGVFHITLDANNGQMIDMVHGQ